MVRLVFHSSSTARATCGVGESESAAKALDLIGKLKPDLWLRSSPRTAAG